MSETKVVVLLPVRNGAEDLPAYLDSVRHVADRILVLDDGSTDGTLEILEANPLVEVVARNSPRPTYAGWDDSANRTRLLDACQEYSPDWIVWFDADEIVDPEDAAALRTFLLRESRRNIALGVRVFRMIGDISVYDKEGLWVYRIFGYRAGYTLSTDRLHFEPIPIQIPASCWHKTTVRLRHLAGTTAARRQARFQKYAEADPECEWQQSYANLLHPPGSLKAWLSRPADLPILWDACSTDQLERFQ